MAASVESLPSAPVRPSVVIWSAGGGRIAKLERIVAPVVSTLIAGVRAYNKFDRIQLSHRSVTTPALRNLTDYLRKGDMFVWVGEAGKGYVPWRQLLAHGVFAVLYQTEPLNVQCALYSDSVNEIWDFSWHNIESCRERSHAAHSKRPRLRWVPLGALPAVRAVGHPAAAPPLFFLGSASRFSGKHRYWCLRDLQKLLGKQLYYRDNVWDEVMYTELMNRHDIFLNIHKGCGDWHNPVTFRVANILNAGGLIISERAHAEDEHMFKNLVTFVPISKYMDPSVHSGLTLGIPASERERNFSAIAEEYWRTTRLSSRERAAAATRRQRLFQARFSPTRIFQRAGIYELFDEQLLGLQIQPHFGIVPADDEPQPRFDPSDATKRFPSPLTARSSQGDGHSVLLASQRRPETSSCSGLHRQGRSAPSNAVLATVDFSGFSPSAFLPFICSFLSNVPSGYLILFVRPPSAMAALPMHTRIRLYPWPQALHSTRFSQIFRYQVYADFLSSKDGRALEKVAVSDAADVAFQSDPFQHVSESDGLVFGLDKDRIGPSHGNRYWIVKLYGAETVKRLGTRNVSTSGFTMGRRFGMAVYLQRMAAEVQRLLVPRLLHMERENWMLAKGYDQGIHNWLLYNEFWIASPPVAVRVLHHDEVYISGAAAMRLDRDIRLDGTVVVNMRNSTIAVVHQWNRMQHLVRDLMGCKRTGGPSETGFCVKCRRSWRVVRPKERSLDIEVRDQDYRATPHYHVEAHEKISSDVWSGERLMFTEPCESD